MSLEQLINDEKWKPIHPQLQTLLSIPGFEELKQIVSFFLTQSQTSVSSITIVLPELIRYSLMDGARVVGSDTCVKRVEDVQVGEEILWYDRIPKRVVNKQTGRGDLYRLGEEPDLVSEENLVPVRNIEDGEVSYIPLLMLGGERFRDYYYSRPTSNIPYRHIEEMDSYVVGYCMMARFREKQDDWKYYVQMAHSAALSQMKYFGMLHFIRDDLFQIVQFPDWDWMKRDNVPDKFLYNDTYTMHMFLSGVYDAVSVLNGRQRELYLENELFFQEICMIHTRCGIPFHTRKLKCNLIGQCKKMYQISIDLDDIFSFLYQSKFSFSEKNIHIYSTHIPQKIRSNSYTTLFLEPDNETLYNQHFTDYQDILRTLLEDIFDQCKLQVHLTTSKQLQTTPTTHYLQLYENILSIIPDKTLLNKNKLFWFVNY